MWKKALVVVLVSACTPEEPAATANQAFVGALDEVSPKENVRVGFVTNGSLATLFFCGEGATIGSTTKWFNALPVTSTASFQGEEGAWKVTGQYTDTDAAGTLDRGDGRVLRWKVKRANEAEEGLYQLQEPEGRAGVVFFTGGAQGVYIRKGTVSDFLQITPLYPGVNTNPEGIPVKYTFQGQERIVRVTPAYP